MASYILAEEKDLVALPDELSYTDGAQVACGFGTVYEGLEKIGISGNDAVLVVGLGPVGLAALMLAKSMGANKLMGVDVASIGDAHAAGSGTRSCVFIDERRQIYKKLVVNEDGTRLLGGILIGLIESLGGQFIAVRWTDVIIFSILVLVLVFRPAGILGRAAPSRS